MNTHKIICGDCIDIMKQFEDNSIDNCVTDPPYGLGFMSKDWDTFPNRKYGEGGKTIPCANHSKPMTNERISIFQQFTYQWATELYRVLKPGAHILVFGGARTYHRMACATEDAGFEIRDMINWVYGSGFPKSLDISKKIDQIKGEKREVVVIGSDGVKRKPRAMAPGGAIWQANQTISNSVNKAAIQWNGWGTGLKPAHEPILLARKPISERNIASNVLKHGTGGINIDGCRISSGENTGRKCGKTQFLNAIKNNGDLATVKHQQGRFPANLILGCCCEEDELVEGVAKSGGGENAIIDGITSISHPHRPFHHCDKKGNEKCLIHTNPNCVCRTLDEQSGECKTNNLNRVNTGIWGNCGKREHIEYKGSSGGASRYFKSFFYQAKASQKERWFYCTICKQAYPMKQRDKHIHNAPEKTKYQYLEFHPTQKPLQLIQYLIRLITPPNGTVIDLFLGSGTGLIAAEREGFNAIGIDSNREYCLISNQRLKNEIEQEQTKLTKEQSTIQRIGY